MLKNVMDYRFHSQKRVWFVPEKSLVFAFKIGREDTFSHRFMDFCRAPETSAICFRTGTYVSVVSTTVWEDQFTFAVGFKHIAGEAFGSEAGEAEFFFRFAVQGHLHAFAQVHVASYGRVPSSRLDVFPMRTFLQVKFAPAVEHMQVYHGVKAFAAIVAFAARGGSDDVPLFIHEGKHLFPVVFLCSYHEVSRGLRDE